VLGVPRLPLELVLHQPLLAGRSSTRLQHRTPWVVGLGGETLAGVDVSEAVVHLVEDPGLVPSHPVTPHQLDRGVGTGHVQAVVVRHDLLPLGVGEHLVAA